jgi:hypothetical protein
MINFTRVASGARSAQNLRRVVLQGLFGLALIAAAGLAAVPLAQATAPSNAGGVLLLHVESNVPYEYGTFDHCGDLKLSDPAKAVTRLAGDGLPRLVGVYAVFPPDSVGSVRAFSFGIRYSQGVQVVGQAPCNTGGMSIALNGWPSSNGGMSVHIMEEGVKKGRIIPLYWFAIRGKSKGSFEVIPHPVPKLAGRFVTAEVPYEQEAIIGYGKIGIDQDGFVPAPGARAVLAPCCVDDCWLLTRQECDLYRGDFLGVGMTCSNSPCREDAYLGGCCLPAGCRMLTLVDCSREGGIPLGESVRCDSVPCPKPSPVVAPPK